MKILKLSEEAIISCGIQKSLGNLHPKHLNNAMSAINDFTPAELSRYARHITIPDFGIEGQQRLKKASALVVGSGGLGSPMLLYLAAAGVGKIGIVDFDVVDESNLQRQVLFTVDDVGQSKAQVAKKRLKALNPHIEVVVHETRFTRENARELVRQYDVVADGTDNFPTRYLVNDACVLEGKVNVYMLPFFSSKGRSACSITASKMANEAPITGTCSQSLRRPASYPTAPKVECSACCPESLAPCRPMKSSNSFLGSANHWLDASSFSMPPALPPAF